MPCYDSRDHDGSCCEATRIDCQHNSDVAELLCAVCKDCERYGVPLSAKLAVWYEEHKERDRQKVADERQRRTNSILRARQVSARALSELNRLLNKDK